MKISMYSGAIVWFVLGGCISMGSMHVMFSVDKQPNVPTDRILKEVADVCVEYGRLLEKQSENLPKEQMTVAAGSGYWDWMNSMTSGFGQYLGSVPGLSYVKSLPGWATEKAGQVYGFFTSLNLPNVDMKALTAGFLEGMYYLKDHIGTLFDAAYKTLEQSTTSGVSWVSDHPKTAMLMAAAIVIVALIISGIITPVLIASGAKATAAALPAFALGLVKDIGAKVKDNVADVAAGKVGEVVKG